MSEAPLFSAEHIKNLEDYVTSLLLSSLSVNTIESYQIQALKLGILNTDEEELCKTIIWELRRTFNLLQNQLEQVLERTDVTKEAVLKIIQDKTIKGARKLARQRKKDAE